VRKCRTLVQKAVIAFERAARTIVEKVVFSTSWRRRMRFSVVTLLAAVAVLLGWTGTAMADGLGPPSGTIYAFDQAYRTVGTPTALPDRGKFDTLYQFPDCASCASVSDAAPGSGNYNGGRWKVVAANGITTQLTNADDVVAQASSLVVTGTRFVCPLIRA
jgi:hypothetical protein